MQKGLVYDKVRMYEEIMTNDDNLGSNLLTSSLLKKRLVYMLVQVELKRMCIGDLPLQVNYAAGNHSLLFKLSAFNLLAITVYTEV